MLKAIRFVTRRVLALHLVARGQRVQRARLRAFVVHVLGYCAFPGSVQDRARLSALHSGGAATGRNRDVGPVSGSSNSEHKAQRQHDQ